MSLMTTPYSATCAVPLTVPDYGVDVMRWHGPLPDGWRLSQWAAKFPYMVVGRRDALKLYLKQVDKHSSSYPAPVESFGPDCCVKDMQHVVLGTRLDNGFVVTVSDPGDVRSLKKYTVSSTQLYNVMIMTLHADTEVLNPLQVTELKGDHWKIRHLPGNVEPVDFASWLHKARPAGLSADTAVSVSARRAKTYLVEGLACLVLAEMYNLVGHYNTTALRNNAALNVLEAQQICFLPYSVEIDGRSTLNHHYLYALVTVDVKRKRYTDVEPEAPLVFEQNVVHDLSQTDELRTFVSKHCIVFKRKLAKRFLFVQERCDILHICVGTSSAVQQCVDKLVRLKQSQEPTPHWAVLSGKDRTAEFGEDNYDMTLCTYDQICITQKCVLRTVKGEETDNDTEVDVGICAREGQVCTILCLRRDLD